MKTPKIQEHMGKNIYSKVRKTKNFCNDVMKDLRG